jgi:hypothetical protein
MAIVVLLGTTGAAVAGSKPVAPPTDTELGFVDGGRAAILERCKRLGIQPMIRPAFPGTDPEAAARIQSIAASFLGEAGFEVVPDASYVAAFDKFNRAIGGIYNRGTGAPRPGALAGVTQSALREYFDQDHLDCVASLQVFESKLNVVGRLVLWNGATERVNGQLPAGVSDFMFGAGDMRGTLPGLSVQLQILDRANKALFTRSGGIQLAAYHDPHRGSGTATFLNVPLAKLLQDDKRIERALRYATVPLRYTADEIAAGANDPSIATALVKLEDLPPVPAGVVAGEETALKVPRDQLLANVHRVVLGPLFATEFKVSPEIAARYRAQVHEELKRLDWEVIDADDLNTIAAESLQRIGGYYDPLTGAQDPAKVAEMMRLIFRGLALTPAPDALLTIALSKTWAPQKFGVAEWYGAEQDAQTLGPVNRGPKLFGGSTNPNMGEGSVTASAVRVMLRDSSNATLYDGVGGLELLQQLSVKPVTTGFRTTSFQQTLTDRAPQELFQDQTRERHAIHFALRELVMSPAEIAAENQPEKPKAH